MSKDDSNRRPRKPRRAAAPRKNTKVTGERSEAAFLHKAATLEFGVAKLRHRLRAAHATQSTTVPSQGAVLSRAGIALLATRCSCLRSENFRDTLSESCSRSN